MQSCLVANITLGRASDRLDYIDIEDVFGDWKLNGLPHGMTLNLFLRSHPMCFLLLRSLICYVCYFTLPPIRASLMLNADRPGLAARPSLAQPF